MRIPLICGLILWWNSALAAQSEEFFFEKLSLEEGLSQNTVQCMLQDSRGFLWIGTANGLNRYDGYSIKIFKRKFNNENCISNNDIRSLFEDANGDLWIGTAGGLNVLKSDSGFFRQFTTLPNDSLSLSHNFIRSISQDKSGKLWIGTGRGGINRYDPQNRKFTVFHHDAKNPGSLSSDFVTAVCAGSDGNIWIGTWGGGLNYYDLKEGSFMAFKNKPGDLSSLSSDKIHAVAMDSSGSMWIATEEGLDKMDVAAHKIQRFGFPLRSEKLSILSILSDGSEFLWVGTSEGLYRFNIRNGQFEQSWQYGYEPIRNRDVLSLCKDRSGILWIGTTRNGILKMNRRNFMTYRYDAVKFPAFLNNNIWAFAEDPGGQVWVGCDENLFLFDPARETITPQFEPVIRAVNLDGRHINSIIPDGKTLWLGTPNGLLEIDRSTGRSVVHRSDPADSNSLSYNSILCLRKDRSGDLWIGTSMGLNKFDSKTKKFRRYVNRAGMPDVISNNTILTLFEDSRGTLWAGTMNGLNRYDSKQEKFYYYKHNPGASSTLSAESVLFINEDRDRKLWIGTVNGLNVLDQTTGKFRYINEENGLPDDVVYGILFDDKNDLWLSSNKGLSRISNDDLARIVTSHDVRELKLSVRSYDERDGLQADEFNANACMRTNAGEMYFGGLRGFNRFRSDQIEYNENPPKVWVTSVKTADIKTDLALRNPFKIELSYDNNTLNFEFVALDFKSPSKNRYAYRLDGVDDDWHYTVARRYATYSNLDPGLYTFRVNGSNNDLVWNAGQPIQIVIRPPFWKTWWFYLLMFIVLATSAVTAYKLRVRQHIRAAGEIEKVRRMENERVRKKASDDFHDEFGHTLTKIAMLAEVLKKEIHSVNEDNVVTLQKIVEASKMLSTGMRDFLWALNPSKDTFAEVAIRIKDFGDELFDQTGTDFIVDDIPSSFETLHLSMQARRHTILIFKEAMHNILKHARARRAELTYQIDGNDIIIRLSDDGVGLNSTPPMDGLGLRSMHRRAGEIKGQLQISRDPTGGTLVSLKLDRTKITNGVFL